ncbi:MAG: 50S ribosomal protein L33 [Candidatus Kerfeldbacteria bacterium]|nr:50S ribosomal protein L33 [Candidatus Kerfeldbacteria bacterium]
MSQENLIKLECTVCKQRTYYDFKKKRLPRLEKNKYCKYCKKHTLHKETK